MGTCPRVSTGLCWRSGKLTGLLGRHGSFPLFHVDSFPPFIKFVAGQWSDGEGGGADGFVLGQVGPGGGEVVMGQTVSAVQGGDSLQGFFGPINKQPQWQTKSRPEVPSENYMHFCPPFGTLILL